jgi:hypothetical protein
MLEQKRPSAAQTRQRHKFMLLGTLAGMESRLRQLEADKSIPPGQCRKAISRAAREVSTAYRWMQSTQVIMP